MLILQYYLYERHYGSGVQITYTYLICFISEVSSGASSAKNAGNNSDTANKPGYDTKSDTPVESEVDPEPHRIRLMSWNIDGLEQNSIVDRTKEVCAIIQK